MVLFSFSYCGFWQINANREINDVFADTSKAVESLLNEDNTDQTDGKIQIKKPIVFILGKTYTNIFPWI